MNKSIFHWKLYAVGGIVAIYCSKKMEWGFEGSWLNCIKGKKKGLRNMDDASTRSILKLLSLLDIAAKYKHYGGVVLRRRRAVHPTHT